MTDGKSRPLVPERSGDDIHFAIAIEIAECGSLAPELIGELLFGKGVQPSRAVVFRARKGLLAGKHRQRKKAAGRKLANETGEAGDLVKLHGLISLVHPIRSSCSRFGVRHSSGVFYL